MTNVQVYLAIGLPIFANAAMFGLVVMCMNARLGCFERRFDAINQRFEDARR